MTPEPNEVELLPSVSLTTDAKRPTAPPQADTTAGRYPESRNAGCLQGGHPNAQGGEGGRAARRALRGKRGVVQTREEPWDADTPWIPAGGTPTTTMSSSPEADMPPFWSQEVKLPPSVPVAVQSHAKALTGRALVTTMMH